MDLTAALVRAAAARPRVLLLTTPGGTAARLAAERELRSRDWPSAPTPAGADLVVVAGPDHPELESALDRLWWDVPRPRARVRVRAAGEVPSALDAGRAVLGDPDRSRSRSCRVAATGESRGRTDHGAPDGRTGHGGHEDRGGGNGTEGHAGHGGHGGDGADMPGGLPMAGTGEDRDGLSLDRLHVSLGPFLADWPAGLTVRVVLQGDILQRVELAEPTVTGSADPFWCRPWARAEAGEAVSTGEAARWRAAAHLDSLGRLLSVAGWPAEAVTARRLRDDLLERVSAEAVSPRLARFAGRVGRSWTLYRMTRGIGRLSAADARAAGVSGPAVRADGDVPARYRQWLAEAVEDVRRMGDTAPLDPVVGESPRGRWEAGRAPSTALAVLLPRLLAGSELAAARLVVASLDPDPDELAFRSEGAARG